MDICTYIHKAHDIWRLGITASITWYGRASVQESKDCSSLMQAAAHACAAFSDTGCLLQKMQQNEQVAPVARVSFSVSWPSFPPLALPLSAGGGVSRGAAAPFGAVPPSNAAFATSDASLTSSPSCSACKDTVH